MNFWLGHKSKFYSIIERFLVRYFYETSDYLTANSKALVEFYSNQILNYSKNIRLIYNGIDFNFDIEQIMKEKDDLLNENNPIVVSVARFDSMKDFDTLLRAASIVISKRNDVKFLLVGDGELKTSILEQIESLNLKNNVFVIGEVANVYGYVNLANVFVLSTTGEGLSNAVLEAMLMAKPVIATSVGGNTELLENMRGVLVSPRNPIELASRIINIINDKGKGEEIGKNAQKYVIDNFSIDRMVNSYEQLFSIAYNKLSMGILNK
jgi:glycosyltransferase involved in cell wall biosynthesis